MENIPLTADPNTTFAFLLIALGVLLQLAGTFFSS